MPSGGRAMPIPPQDGVTPDDDERLAELAGAILRDEIEQRRQLAKYLHDTLLQTLVILAFKASEDPSTSLVIDECCRQARVMASLLFTPSAGDGDLTGFIAPILESLKQDARIHIELKSQRLPPSINPAISSLVFDLIMEFARDLILQSSELMQIIYLSEDKGWIILDLPSQWGRVDHVESTLSALRIKHLGGGIERDGSHGRMRVQLPLGSHERSNPDS